MSEDKNQEVLELVDVNITKHSLEYLRKLFDIYCREGKYGLDDAQKIIIAVNNINKSLTSLNTMQTIALSSKQKQKDEEIIKANTLEQTESNVIMHKTDVIEETNQDNDEKKNNEQKNEIKDSTENNNSNQSHEYDNKYSNDVII